MNAIADAKARVVAEKNKFTTAAYSVLGSRALLAFLTLFMIAFGTQALYAPSQLPAVGGLDMVQSVLHANLDFGWIGEQAQEAQAAAERQGVTARALNFIAAHPVETNRIGFAAALAMLIGNLLIASHKWRSGTGVVVGAP